MTIKLTPHHSLQWNGEEVKHELKYLESSFVKDWREGLFLLSSNKQQVSGFPLLYFWQGFANRFLTSLCHLPENEILSEVKDLSSEDYAELVLNSPPMEGGEYLSIEAFQKIWEAMNHWVLEKGSNAASVRSFLQEHAPKWSQVGRVCFHLAENKQNEERPFAFLATFTSGFSPSGRLKHLPLKKALEQYSGEQNRSTLIKLLSPVQKASETCKWIKKLVQTQQIYQALTWEPSQAYQFLQSVPMLKESGLTTRLPNWWKKRTNPKVEVSIGEKRKNLLGVSEMLDFNVQVALGEQNLTQEEISELLKGEDGLILFKGQWIEVDRERLQEALQHWDEVKKQNIDGNISFIEGMRLLAGASSDLKHQDKTENERAWVHVAAGDGLKEILSGLRNPSQLLMPDITNALQATLRSYQKEGVAWLHFLTQLGLGACLADDMGLGKTIQVLSLLLSKKSLQRVCPSLLVVPSSLLANWKSEATRFTPSLKIMIAHPAEMSRKTLDAIASSPEKLLSDTDLLITSYSLLSRYQWIREFKWNLIILDEAQAIKNPGTAQTKSVKKLYANSRIALTGTPVENKIGDLWSLFDFINPGLLGSSNTFKSFIKDLQNRETQQFSSLRQLVSPYILRRMKTNKEIIRDLPDKIESNCYCSLSKLQIKLYKQTVLSMKGALSSLDGIARKGLVLQTLMRLKQICNHPSQFSGDGYFEKEHSGKFLRIATLCEELAERQQKVLVFSQFREIIDPLSEHLSTIFKRPGLTLHGGTSVKKRKDIVDQFQDNDGPPFFILSLKAGGTGLNLTAASHVIHFDRWWNPAVENQATDRAFRIGQKKNVLVHKFVTQGTIEEKIDAMISEKQKIANEILSGEAEVNITELDDEELMKLVQLDIKQI